MTLLCVRACIRALKRKRLHLLTVEKDVVQGMQLLGHRLKVKVGML